MTSRLGHFAANTELYLSEIRAGIRRTSPREIHLFCHDGKVSNIFFLKICKRNLNILPRWFIFPLLVISKLFPFSDRFNIEQPIQHDRDILNLLGSTSPILVLNNEEIEKGWDELKSFNVPKDSKIVCITVRDSEYLNKEFPGGDFSYHNYRDCSIENYHLAIKELVMRDYYVFRMGKVVKKKLDNSSPKVIDYANSENRSDFLDIFLGTVCTFAISTSTGWDAIPYIYRKPIVYTPIVPIGYMFTFSNRFIAITKHHFLSKENRFLTLREIFEKGLAFALHSNSYTECGVELIENSPREILDIVIEMDEMIEKKNVLTVKDEERQKRFWDIFIKNQIFFKGNPGLHGKILARYGKNFLRENESWLD